MDKWMKIIFLLILIGGLSACGKPAANENTDTAMTTENTEEMTEVITTEAVSEEEVLSTENISEGTVEAAGKETTEKETDTAATDSKGSSAADNETKDNSDSGYFGTWQVTAYYMPGISAMSAEDAEAYIGKTCEYSADLFNGNGEVTDAPVYQEFMEAESDFSANYRGATFESLGITGDLVKLINVSNSYGFGCIFYIKDANTILICQDGVFFEAVRQ